MTFLAPWALAFGGAAALGAVLLHLVSSQRPAAYMLPTAQFIPDERTLVSRAATRPRDLLLLLLRLIVLLAAAAAFARPVLTPSRGAMARVIVLDLSASTASVADAVTHARALADSAAYALVVVDSTARIVGAPVWDSLRIPLVRRSSGSLSAGLIAARRASAALAERADSVEMVVISPVAAREVDAATPVLAEQWPGRIRIIRTEAAHDSARSLELNRAIALTDPLGPSIAGAAITPSANATRVVRGVPANADSVFARNGGLVVQWDTAARTAQFHANGLAAGNDVFVALMARGAAGSGEVIARWSDGVPAATQTSIGSGCIRQVGVVIPPAGDLALHAPFRRFVHSMLTSCGALSVGQPLDSASISRTFGSRSNAAESRALRDDSNRPSPLSRWLLAIALTAAVGELLLRNRGEVEAQ